MLPFCPAVSSEWALEELSSTFLDGPSTFVPMLRLSRFIIMNEYLCTLSQCKELIELLMGHMVHTFIIPIPHPYLGRLEGI